MQCIDEPSKAMDLYGEIVDSSSKVFVVALAKCSGEEYCKKDEEIDAFIDESTFQYSFDQQIYNPEIYSDTLAVQSVITDILYLKNYIG